MTTAVAREEPAVQEEPVEQPVLRVSTNYMATYQLVEPASGGSEVHAFTNPSGGLDLYTVGTDGQVYRFHPSPGEHAAYTAEPLGIRARQLALFPQSGGGSPDRPQILGIGDDGRLTLSTYHAATGSYVQVVSQPSGATARLRRFAGVKGAGNVYANVVLDDGRLATSFLRPDGTWASSNWAPIKGPDGKDVHVKDVAMCANSPVQSALFAIDEKNRVLFSDENFRVSQMRALGTLEALHLAVVVDPKGLLHIFAIDLDGHLWLKRQKQYSSGGQVEFFDWERLDSTVALGRVYAGLRFDNVLEVFGIGADGRLYYLHQLVDDRDRVIGWDAPFPLGDEIGGSVFTAARSGSGFSEAFTVGHDNRLRRFYQSPETAQWFTQPVEHGSARDQAVEVPTHAVELTVLDENGVVQSEAEVSIAASFPVDLSINGRTYFASPVDAVRVKADPAGRLVVLQRATSLAGATLYVETPHTAAGAPLAVEPNGQLQAKLAVITADDVRASGLLRDPKPGQAESLAAIMRQSMEVSGPAAMRQPVLRLHASRRRGLPEPRRRIDVAAVAGEGWEIDFSSGFPQYRALTGSEAADRVAEWRLAEPEGFLGIDWGAVWNAIRTGVEWIVNGLRSIVVEIDRLVGRIKVFFRILWEGVVRTFEAVLEWVQQAFDFVVGVWNWLKVKIEQLYEWLKALFNWADIARTADAIAYSVDQLLDFTVKAIDSVHDKVAQGFDQAKGEIERNIDAFVGLLDGRLTLGTYGTEDGRDDPEVDHAMDHNVLLNAFTQNHDRGRTLATAVRLAADDPMAVLLERLKQMAGEFEFGDGKRAFDEGLSYFTKAGDQPERALQLALAGLIKVFEAVALFAVDVAKGVVLSILDLVAGVVQALRGILTEEWEIPVVSQIYQLIAGRAPFPDDDSLRAYKSSFTAGWLLGQAGIGPVPAEVAGWPGGDRPVVATLFRVLYIVVVGIRAVAESIMVTLVAIGAGPAARPVMLAGPILNAITSVFTTPWILRDDAGPLQWTVGDPGFSNVIWMLQCLFGPCTLGTMWYFKAPAEVSQSWMTLWGWTRVGLVAANYAKSAKRDSDELARDLTLYLPAFALRFLCLPALNTPATLYIPVMMLVLLIPSGFGVSIAITVQQIEKQAEAAGLLAGWPRQAPAPA